jgi:hypothetical protein
MSGEFKRVSVMDEWRQAVLYRAAQVFGAALARGDTFAAFQVFAEGQAVTLQVTAACDPVSACLVLNVVEQTSGHFLCRSKPAAIDHLSQDDPGNWWDRWDPNIDDEGASLRPSGS